MAETSSGSWGRCPLFGNFREPVTRRMFAILILSLWCRLTVAAKMGVTKAVSFPNEDSKKRRSGSQSASAMPSYIQEHDMRFWLAAAIGALVPTLAAAQPAMRPVVGELFTSEGCSSCPPADAKVAELARTRPALLLLLTFLVTYWNSLGSHDPYSFDISTQRQLLYVALGVSPEVY